MKILAFLKIISKPLCLIQGITIPTMKHFDGPPTTTKKEKKKEKEKRKTYLANDSKKSH
jgi:hypothetical protein